MSIEIVGPKALFPSTIFIGKINPKNKEEIQEDIIQKFENANDNISLTKSNLIDNNIYQNLSDNILLLCYEYFQSLNYKNIKPRITCMWGVCINKDTNLYKHRHSNSFVSGVWYPFDTKVGLNFYKDDGNNFILPDRDDYNILNSSEQKFIPFENACFLFPSSLLHDTDINKSEIPRYSISFNIFVTGNLGTHETLNYLQL